MDYLTLLIGNKPLSDEGRNYLEQNGHFVLTESTASFPLSELPVEVIPGISGLPEVNPNTPCFKPANALVPWPTIEAKLESGHLIWIQSRNNKRTEAVLRRVEDAIHIVIYLHIVPGFAYFVFPFGHLKALRGEMKYIRTFALLRQFANRAATFPHTYLYQEKLRLKEAEKLINWSWRYHTCISPEAVPTSPEAEEKTSPSLPKVPKNVFVFSSRTANIPWKTVKDHLDECHLAIIHWSSISGELVMRLHANIVYIVDVRISRSRRVCEFFWFPYEEFKTLMTRVPRRTIGASIGVLKKLKREGEVNFHGHQIGLTYQQASDLLNWQWTLLNG